MKTKLSLIAVALTVAACNSATTSETKTTPSEPQQQVTTPAPAPAPAVQTTESAVNEKSVELTFIDISGFDEDLSLGMAGKNREIIVDLPGKVSLNDVPDRLDQWFAEIKKGGGKVQAKELPKKNALVTRGIVGMLIDLGVNAHKMYAHEQMLKPAQEYNVVLEYDKDTGIVERAVFSHR